MTRLTFALLALLAVVTPATAQDHLPVVLQDGSAQTQDARMGWNPIQRALCIGLTDDACADAATVWPTDRNVLGVVAGADDPNNSDASWEIWNLSNRPNDPRALACMNVGAQESFGQVCAYGTNYPLTVAGQKGGWTKFAAYNTMHVVTYAGPILFMPDQGLTATVNPRGIGLYDYPCGGSDAAGNGATGYGCISLGLYQAPTGPRPWWGADIFVKMGPEGLAVPYVRLSDGTHRRIKLE